MNHFYNILKYAKPYKSYAIGHIISNVFFALFGTLSFIALKPMLDVIFKNDKVAPEAAPAWSGLLDIG
ncbi:MAG: ABC transporter ATP-binding protein, partial [Algibacter sp.]